MSWPTKKLEEVLEYEQPTKYLVSSTDYKDEYLIPVLTAGKSFILGNTNEKNGIFPKEKLPVIIFDDFTTAIKFVDFPFKVKSSAMKILHAKKNEANIKYLFNKLLTIKFSHNQHKRYWISECSKVKITLPPLAVQKQIVERLDKIAEAQKLNDKQIALADELFQSLLYRELDPKGKNWGTKELENLVLNGKNGIKIGPFGSALKIGELVERGPVRVFYIENVVNNEFDWSKEKYITAEKYKELTVYTVNPSDVLITIMGTIGRVCIVPQNIGKAIISSHLIKITPNKKLILSDFLYFSFIGSSFVKKQMIDQATGAIMSGLNSAILRNLKIPLPPLETQKKIVEKLSAVQDYKKKLFEQKEKLKELFESVLNKSMKRELVK